MHCLKGILDCAATVTEQRITAAVQMYWRDEWRDVKLWKFTE